MRWKGRQASSNVEDRRGRRGGGKVVGGGIGVLVIAVIVYFLGGDPTQVLQQAADISTEQTADYQPTAAENEAAEFVKVVLRETELYWQKEFLRSGFGTYEEPTLSIVYR